MYVVARRPSRPMCHVPQSPRAASSAAALTIVQAARMGRLVSRVEVAELLRPAHLRKRHHAAILKLDQWRSVLPVLAAIVRRYQVRAACAQVPNNPLTMRRDWKPLRPVTFAPGLGLLRLGVI